MISPSMTSGEIEISLTNSKLSPFYSYDLERTADTLDNGNVVSSATKGALFTTSNIYCQLKGYELYSFYDTST